MVSDMSVQVFIDGFIHDEQTAVVSVFDRGFLYGDSVYEVTRTAGGRPVDLPRHLDRLARSAAAIYLEAPPAAVIADAIGRTLAAARNPDSYVRVVVTRGAGKIGLDVALADAPQLIVIVKPLELPPPALYETGVEVALVAVRRNLRQAVDPAVKSGNYLNNVMAFAEGKRRGAHEAIMCNVDGFMVEGSTSNIFVVGAGVVSTPALDGGLLDGITRRRVLDLLRGAGRQVTELPLRPEALRMAEEAFLTSSIRGVLPVTHVDGTPIGGGVPGATTRDLMQRYELFLQGIREGDDGAV